MKTEPLQIARQSLRIDAIRAHDDPGERIVEQPGDDPLLTLEKHGRSLSQSPPASSKPAVAHRDSFYLDVHGLRVLPVSNCAYVTYR